MIRSIPQRFPTSLIGVEANDLQFSTSLPRVASTVCCSSKSNAYIPKLEPFSRSKFDRIVREPPLIQKSETELSDYCSTLQGDPSYSCWKAYFELKDLEKQFPKEDVEKLILQAGGVKSLVGYLHGIAAIHKSKSEVIEPAKEFSAKKQGERPFPVPDGLPKSEQEIEEEEKYRMPDSPYTRLLRTKGRFPAWYSPAPDHETD